VGTFVGIVGTFVGILGTFVGIVGTFVGIVGTFIFCRNYGKKWEMSRRNYGKISVGIMGKYPSELWEEIVGNSDYFFP
jgi:hypothetical protein